MRTRTRSPRRITAGEWVVDLRNRTAFAAGHVTGTLNFGVDGQFATYLGWLIPWGTPLTLLGDSPEQVAEAQRELVRIGIDHLEGAATGNPAGLDRPAARLASSAPRSPTSPRSATTAGSPSSTSAAPQRVHRRRTSTAPSTSPCTSSSTRVDEVPTGEVWVHCAGGYRASIAASVLAAHGYPSSPSTTASDEHAAASGLPSPQPPDPADTPPHITTTHPTTNTDSKGEPPCAVPRTARSAEGPPGPAAANTSTRSWRSVPRRPTAAPATATPRRQLLAAGRSSAAPLRPGARQPPPAPHTRPGRRRCPPSDRDAPPRPGDSEPPHAAPGTRRGQQAPLSRCPRRGPHDRRRAPPPCQPLVLHPRTAHRPCARRPRRWRIHPHRPRPGLPARPGPTARPRPALCSSSGLTSLIALTAHARAGRVRFGQGLMFGALGTGGLVRWVRPGLPRQPPNPADRVRRPHARRRSPDAAPVPAAQQCCRTRGPHRRALDHLPPAHLRLPPRRQDRCHRHRRRTAHRVLRRRWRLHPRPRPRPCTVLPDARGRRHLAARHRRQQRHRPDRPDLHRAARTSTGRSSRRSPQPPSPAACSAGASPPASSPATSPGHSPSCWSPSRCTPQPAASPLCSDADLITVGGKLDKTPRAAQEPLACLSTLMHNTVKDVATRPDMAEQ